MTKSLVLAEARSTIHIPQNLAAVPPIYWSDPYSSNDSVCKNICLHVEYRNRRRIFSVKDKSYGSNPNAFDLSARILVFLSFHFEHLPHPLYFAFYPGKFSLTSLSCGHILEYVNNPAQFGKVPTFRTTPPSSAQPSSPNFIDLDGYFSLHVFLRVNYRSKTLIFGVKDKCSDCPIGFIDLSRPDFSFFMDPSVGGLLGKCTFVNC